MFCHSSVVHSSEVIQTISCAVRDRRTIVGDRIAKWKLDVNGAIAEAAAAFPAGLPEDVKTAEAELRKVFEASSTVAANVLKAFHEMHLVRVSQRSRC